MKKKSLILACMLLVIMLGGCAENDNSEEVTTLSIDKKGTVTGTIVETMEKDYYDIDELKAMITHDIAQYNTEAGAEKIVLNSSDITEERATAKITYADAETYAAFNDMTFFTGTAEELKAAGYDLDSITLESTDNQEEKTEKTEKAKIEALLADQSMHAVVFEEPVRVRTFGTIQAVSSGMTLMNKKEAAVTEATDEQLHMILFK